jgi:hypothetical protein
MNGCDTDMVAAPAARPDIRLRRDIFCKSLAPMSNPLLGYICCLLACIGYGSNYAPAKYTNTGDGMFFQFIVALAIFLTGLVFTIVRAAMIGGPMGKVDFEPLAVVGGVIWATGNICVVPVMRTIGCVYGLSLHIYLLGCSLFFFVASSSFFIAYLIPANRLSLGLLIWGATALLCGWATARFGIIIDVEPVTVEWMNTVGVILCLIALGTYFFVETDATATGTSDSDDFPSASHFDMESPLTDSTTAHKYDLVSKSAGGLPPSAVAEEEAGYIDSMSPAAKRVCGVLLSVASGLFYGCNFLPPQYLSDHHAEGHSKDLPRCLLRVVFAAEVATCVYA